MVSKMFAGRRFQPAALSLMIAAAVSGLTLLPLWPWHTDYHPSPHVGGFRDLATHLGGVLALVVAVGFAVAWWARSARLLDRMLQASTFLWIWVAVDGALQGAAAGRVALALAWAILAGGSAWLEQGDRS